VEAVNRKAWLIAARKRWQCFHGWFGGAVPFQRAIQQEIALLELSAHLEEQRS